MNFEGILIREVELDEKFNYKSLYNDYSRGAVFKEEYKKLIKEAINNNKISVKKYIIAENIQEEMLELANSKGIEFLFLNRIKDYPNEHISLVIPFIYILKQLDSEFKIEMNDELIIKSNLFEVEICPRIDGANAQPRLFFKKEKIALASTNDNVQNLGEILSVPDIEVFIIGIEPFYQEIYAYKIMRSEAFLEVAQDYSTSLQLELFKNKSH